MSRDVEVEDDEPEVSGKGHRTPCQQVEHHELRPIRRVDRNLLGGGGAGRLDLAAAPGRCGPGPEPERDGAQRGEGQRGQEPVLREVAVELLLELLGRQAGRPGRRAEHAEDGHGGERRPAGHALGQARRGGRKDRGPRPPPPPGLRPIGQRGERHGGHHEHEERPVDDPPGAEQHDGREEGPPVPDGEAERRARRDEHGGREEVVLVGLRPQHPDHERRGPDPDGYGDHLPGGSPEDGSHERPGGQGNRRRGHRGEGCGQPEVVGPEQRGEGAGQDRERRAGRVGVDVGRHALLEVGQAQRLGHGGAPQVPGGVPADGHREPLRGVDPQEERHDRQAGQPGQDECDGPSADEGSVDHRGVRSALISSPRHAVTAHLDRSRGRLDGEAGLRRVTLVVARDAARERGRSLVVVREGEGHGEAQLVAGLGVVPGDHHHRRPLG